MTDSESGNSSSTSDSDSEYALVKKTSVAAEFIASSLIGYFESIHDKGETISMVTQVKKKNLRR